MKGFFTMAGRREQLVDLSGKSVGTGVSYTMGGLTRYVDDSAVSEVDVKLLGSNPLTGY